MNGKPQIREDTSENLRQVYDPETPVNVYDLGLIYEININGDCDIVMTLTSAFCPAADEIIADVNGACFAEGIETCNVDITFDPPFGANDKMSEEVKMMLGVWE